MSKDLASEKRRGEGMVYKEVIRAIVGAKVFGPFRRANRETMKGFKHEEDMDSVW